MNNEPIPIRAEPELPYMTLSKEETAILWQLIDKTQAGVPFKHATTAGELYRTVREYARAHGINVET